MKKVFFSFVLACFAVAVGAQISQTPIQTITNEETIVLFTYENGEQVFIRGAASRSRWFGNFPTVTLDSANTVLSIYDLSFSLRRTIDFSTIPGFEHVHFLGIIENNLTMGHNYTIATNRVFDTNSNLLEFLVRTQDGFAIVNENRTELLEKVTATAGNFILLML